MQRGYIILTAGAILLVKGMVISALSEGSFAGTIVNENTITVGEATVNPSQTISANTHVTELGRPISLAIHSKASSNVILIETVKDPNGRVINQEKFTKQFFTTFKPNTLGNYTLSISNLGPGPTTVDSILSYLPFTSENSRVDLNALRGIIAGIILIIIGIITLIIGLALVLIDRRRGKKAFKST
jgi:uncharacterized membrane protein